MKKVSTILLIVVVVILNFSFVNAEILSKMESNEVIEVSITDEEWDNLQEKVDIEVDKIRKLKAEGFTGIKYKVIEEEINSYSTVNEVEENDTLKLADRVYVGDRVYSAISERGDIDYYKIKFPTAGYVTISLKYIPEGCDYELYLLGANGDEVGNSINAYNDDEYIYTFVTPNIYYYIMVEGVTRSSYSDEEYCIRIAEAEDIEEFAFSVGTDFRKYVEHDEINTTDVAEYASDIFMDAGYRSKLCTTPTYSILDSKNADGTDVLGSSVVFLDGHGAPKHLRLNYHSNNNSGFNKYNTGVSTNFESDGSIYGPDVPIFVGLRSKDISDCRLMVFSACQTANAEEGTSITKYAVNKGVETAIGWREDINDRRSRDWNERFLRYLEKGSSVVDSADYADELFTIDSDVASWRIYGNYDNVINRFGPYTIDEDNENINLINFGEEVIQVNSSENDFSNLENFIHNYYDDTFNIESYRKVVHEVADNVYKVGYMLYSDEFDTGYGYTALIKNDLVEKIKEINPEVKATPLSDIIVTDREIESIKETATNEIDGNYVIVEQEIKKVIKNSKHFIEVYTTYAIDYGTEYETYGCKLYEQILD